MTTFIRTTAVLSVLVLIGLHLPLQAEPPKIAPPRLDVRVSGNGLTASSSSASLMLQIAGPNDFQVTQHSKDGSLNWYNPGTLIDGHYNYDVYAIPNIQRQDLTKAELDAIPTTRQSGRFRVEQGRLLVEPDPAAQRSSLPDLSTLWAALVDQLIPSAAAQDLTITDPSPLLIWDDTDDDDGDNMDWIIEGQNNSGTSTDRWTLFDSTHTGSFPLNIFGGANNHATLVVGSLGGIFLADGAVYIDRSLGHLNIGSITETCCELFVTGDSIAQLGLRSTSAGASTWQLKANSAAFFVSENDGGAIFLISKGAPDASLWIKDTGHIGLGTLFPADKLHVKDGNLRIEQDNADNHATLNFIANGNTWEIKNNKDTGRLTFFAPGGGATTASFKFDRQAQENLFRVGVLGGDTVDINGDLVVTGTLSNPDYVFEPEYALESIDDHAAYMWENKHLPAVGTGKVNAQGHAMVNVATRSQGMLEELEKAHIYIEQLHGEVAANEAQHKTQLETAQHSIEHLQGEVTALKAKEARLETLEGEMAALKALVHDQVAQRRGTLLKDEG